MDLLCIPENRNEHFFFPLKTQRSPFQLQKVENVLFAALILEGESTVNPLWPEEYFTMNVYIIFSLKYHELMLNLLLLYIFWHNPRIEYPFYIEYFSPCHLNYPYWLTYPHTFFRFIQKNKFMLIMNGEHNTIWKNHHWTICLKLWLFLNS